MSTPNTPKAPESLVYRLGSPRVRVLGTVKAPASETALVMAYDKFSITSPADREHTFVGQVGNP